MKQHWFSYSGWFLFLFLALLLLFALDLAIGSVHIPLSEVASILFGQAVEKSEWQTIVLSFRLPKAITAVVAGMALALSGLQMQTIFRNPLAGPYVLGISSGASLGVAVLVLGFPQLLALGALTAFSQLTMALAAWAGAGLILLLILAVSFRIKDVMVILVLGILFGGATSAIVSILQFFSNESMLKVFIVWTLGSLSGVTQSQLQVFVPAVIVGSAMVFLSVKPLNIMLLGENYARTMGLNVKMARILIFISTSILAGSVTAFCGPLGFVGIVVPHIARMMFRTANHNTLIPASMLIGAIVMLFSDILSQLPAGGRTLPVNAVTAIIGVPLVIWIVLRNRKVM